MFKKLLALSLVFILALNFSACKPDTDGKTGINGETTQKITRIFNSFKDVLPDFKFDSDPIENYVEGVSYSFSAECSSNKFNKYVKEVKKSGFEIKAAEGKGYYKAYNAEKYFVELVLVDGTITAFVKR